MSYCTRSQCLIWKYHHQDVLLREFVMMSRKEFLWYPAFWNPCIRLILWCASVSFYSSLGLKAGSKELRQSFLWVTCELADQCLCCRVYGRGPMSFVTFTSKCRFCFLAAPHSREQFSAAVMSFSINEYERPQDLRGHICTKRKTGPKYNIRGTAPSALLCKVVVTIHLKTAVVLSVGRKYFQTGLKIVNRGVA